MENNIVQFEVSSPEELAAALAGHPAGDRARPAVVRVFGPMVVTRSFLLRMVSTPELEALLKVEAGQDLSMDPGSVEVVWQLLSTQGDHVSGVLTAMPRVLLEEYLEAFKKSALVPVGLIAASAWVVEEHLMNAQGGSEDYCLVSFLRPGMIGAVVFLNGEPAFFREMADVPDEEVPGRVADTIRYCLARSANKEIEKVICIGNTLGKEALVLALQKSVATSKRTETPSPNGSAVRFAAPNLLKKHVLDVRERARLSCWLGWGIAVVLVVMLWGVWRLADGLYAFRYAQGSG